ncbi:serine hydrolase domain-containing protein [Rathayibacter sp. YIM 133350]|uniref:serine hydrolase domain-containing protein n=1 Tax=Rathayibacter sp. YIM 133350 TaxID=3131992 RepID=UPI00307E2251
MTDAAAPPPRPAAEIDPAALQQAVRLVRERDAAAQLCIIRDGVVVLDASVRCADDALFWTFSAGKPFVTVLLLMLAERGLVDLDESVASYWPEFARNGKSAITIRHVLQHRSGFATTGSPVADALAMSDWPRMIGRIERTRPRHPPGWGPAYQWIAYGFIIGEIAQRVSGRPLPELLSTEILEPLELADTFLGLPPHHRARSVATAAPGVSGAAVRSLVNRPRTRAAVIPSAGISTTARDLARFYLALLGGGDAPRLLAPQTLADALTPTSDGMLDRFARTPIRWSNGFQIGGSRGVPGAVNPMGTLSSPRAFGHNGSNCCMAWADPDRRLVFSYLTSTLPPARERFDHLVAVADAVLAGCPG